MIQRLTHTDYDAAATALGCETACVMAVAEVEAPGGGFLSDGRVKILFEAHKFSKYTHGEFDTSHPRISSPTWNQKLYRGPEGEWDRLSEALQLERRAALLSASWGKFQIMGFNYALCGFAHLEDFVASMKLGEGAQLDAFVEFLKARDLDDELARHDWAGFARGYNGAGFSKNKYDLHLAAAYKKFSAELVSA